eukprot:Skav228780  [mRNA]  locus=scaffold589:606908:617112:- [translate_table: standard]
MHLLKIVTWLNWLIECRSMSGSGGSVVIVPLCATSRQFSKVSDKEGKPRLHAHRASSHEDFRDVEAMSISAAGQPVMRREAKQDSEERLSDDEIPVEQHRPRRRGTETEALVATEKAFPIKVEGCQDAATGHVIEGTYTPAGTSDDKPLYKKEGSSTGDDEVWLYHYADVDAGSDDYVMKVEEQTCNESIHQKELGLLEQQLQCLKLRQRRGGSDDVMNHYRSGSGALVVPTSAPQKVTSNKDKTNPATAAAPATSEN